MIVQKVINNMFFLVTLVLIIQIFILAIFISTLLNLDIKLLMAVQEFKAINLWLKGQQTDINKIFSDLTLIIKKCYKRFEYLHRLNAIFSVIGLIEWLLFPVLKPCGKKCMLGYKLTKVIVKELSMYKNMV